LGGNVAEENRPSGEIKGITNETGVSRTLGKDKACGGYCDAGFSSIQEQLRWYLKLLTRRRRSVGKSPPGFEG